MQVARLMSVVGVLAVSGCAFAQTGIDGVIDLSPTGDWSGPGVITNSVLYNSSAPTSNFGSPTNENHNVAYTTYMRFDGSFFYFAVAANPGAGGGINGLVFSNIYLTTVPANGSTIGLEYGGGNNNFFVPGVPGSYSGAGITTQAQNNSTGVLEVAIPLSFFANDPLGMGFTPVNAPGAGVVQWRLSQSLGYSVAGGTSYGDNRLGVIAVPAPAAASLAGLGGLAAMRRRRR
ncbi:MAG: hypothetical protein QM783_17695 [Phycisphaerales bacterium]